MVDIPLAPFRRAFDAARDPLTATNALFVQPGVHVLPIDSGGNAQVGDAHIALTEIGDPSAPGTDQALLYVRDNGAGKTQLVIRFPTGAIQVIATEP